MIFPANIHTLHLGQSSRGLSPRLWSRVDGQQLGPDGSTWYMVGDDFLNFGATFDVASNVGRYASEGGGYKSYEDTGAAIAQSAVYSGGVVTMTVDADDNQEAWLQSGGGTGVLGAISDTAGSDKACVFESRFAPSQVTAGNLFVGLSEEALAAGDTITDAGAMASKDFIGFGVLEAAPTILNFTYRKAGQTVQIPIASLATLTAGAFVKTGFVYDPAAPRSRRISIFLDNVEQSTYVTADMIAAATFPDGEELAFLAGIKNDTDIMGLHLDWWNYAQRG